MSLVYWVLDVLSDFFDWLTESLVYGFVELRRVLCGKKEEE